MYRRRSVRRTRVILDERFQMDWLEVLDRRHPPTSDSSWWRRWRTEPPLSSSILKLAVACREDATKGVRASLRSYYISTGRFASNERDRSTRIGSEAVTLRAGVKHSKSSQTGSSSFRGKGGTAEGGSGR